MKSRSAVLFCLILLLLALASRAPPSQAQPSLKIVDFSAPDIGMGFGPSDVQPVADGVPIYTQGDNVWIESYYNSTIFAQLLYPDGSQAASSVVDPGQLSKLYSLAENDPPGNWTLTITALTGTSSIHLLVVSPDSSATPTYLGADLTENKLDQSFALPPTDAYNIQACSAGRSIGPSLTLRVAGAGNGTIQVSLGKNASLLSAYQMPVPFETWLELYSQYSYSLNGGGTVSQNLLVASTPVTPVSAPSAPQSLQWTKQLPMREGRFDLRVFERNSVGLSLQDAPFLRTSSGSWVSLNSCTSMVDVYSTDFTLTTDLDSANSSWPRQLFTLYTLNGVESYANTTVPGDEAAIHIIDSPRGQPLTGVTITPSAPGLGPSDWDAFNSTAYITTGRPAGQISLKLSFGGVITEILNASITAPYTSKTLSVKAGTLVASTTLQGARLQNATVSVASLGSQPVAMKLGASGFVSLLLPPDNYTVSATYAGVSSTEVVPVTEGQVSSVTLQLGQTSIPASIYLLVAVGIAGLVASILIWRQYLERRKVYS